MEIVLVGGPGEQTFAQEVSQMLGGAVVNVTGRTNLRDLIGIFSRARLALGPDSGPMHIAAATGTPVVSLWGATSPARSAPWGSEAFVVRGSAACSPCYVRRCRIGRLCMQRITPEQVLAAARQVLDQR
jgi:ADP-heptose:LPS heptosyltransferase